MGVSNLTKAVSYPRPFGMRANDLLLHQTGHILYVWLVPVSWMTSCSISLYGPMAACMMLPR